MSLYFTEPEWADPGRLRTDEDSDQVSIEQCDTCGVRLHWTDNEGRGPIRLVGLGAFCSAGCADVASEQHAFVMSRLRAAGE
jgi:hypothetical protein